MASVELQNITKVFPGGVRAVDGLSLSIADRELVVLVGPSGCGKSTTLRMIAGLEEPTDGRIIIDGQTVNAIPPKDRNLAMVFQNHALYPHMTVYANLAFGLKMRRMRRPEIHERVLGAARMLDIEGLLDRKPAALSGGQRQRVAVGRAIVRQPAVFLLDEPLSQLDARLRITTRAELKRLQRQIGATMLYVTHDQEEAMTLGDRIVIMKEGRIQQSDAPLAAYNLPVNRFVAGFIGMPPMNFFDGTIRAEQGRLFFEEGKAARQVSGGAGEEEPGVNELTSPGKGFRLVVPLRLREAAQRRIGKRVVLGIRPEHFHLEPPDVQEKASIEVHVTVVEPLGNDIDVYAKTSLHDPVVARVQAHQGLGVGCAIRLHADARKIHFFEPGETGMNLSLTSEPAHAIA